MELPTKVVKWKEMKTLVRKNLIKLTHVSDDGEFVRFTVPPHTNPEYGMWCPFGEEALVFSGHTIPEHFVKAYPHLFEEQKP